MGHSESSHYKTLVREYEPAEWRVVELLRDCELWQNQISLHKFMAYPINLGQSDSQQILQMLHFRKLNSSQLISPEYVLKNKNDNFCSQTSILHLLVQNIPVRLSQINRFLSFESRLYILSVVFTALQTLNYVFGPLFISQDMIGFNQRGQVKMWANELFSSSRPSRPARTQYQDRLTTSSTLRIEKRLQDDITSCVTQVFRTVGNWELATYPPDFRAEASQINTFAQGEQFISSYCRHRGIQLPQSVPFWEHFQRRETRPKAYSQEEYFGHPTSSLRSQRNSQHTSLVGSNANLPYSSARINKPLTLEQSIVREHYSSGARFEPRFSVASQVRISYGFQPRIIHMNPPQQTMAQLPIQINSQKKISFHVPAPVQTPTQVARVQPSSPVMPRVIQKPEVQIQQPQKLSKAQPQKVPIHVVNAATPSPSPAPQPVVLTRPKPSQNISQNSTPYRNVAKESAAVSIQPSPQVEKTSPEAQKQRGQESHISHSDNSELNMMNEIQMWQASMLMKLSTKKNTNPSPNSEIVPGLTQSKSVEYFPSSKPVQEAQESSFKKLAEPLTGADYEKYVRNKYSDYIEQPKIESKKHSYSYHHQSYSFGPGPIDMERSEPSVRMDAQQKNQRAPQTKINKKTKQKPFRKPSFDAKVEDINNLKQKSYDASNYNTFGKIEYDPLSSYNKITNETITVTDLPQPTRKVSKYNSNNRIDERYQKYVVNRQAKKSSNFSQQITSKETGRSKNSSFQVRHQNEDIPKKEKLNTIVDLFKDSRTNTNPNERLENSNLERSKPSLKTGSLTYDRLRQLLRN